MELTAAEGSTYDQAAVREGLLGMRIHFPRRVRSQDWRFLPETDGMTDADRRGKLSGAAADSEKCASGCLAGDDAL
jgi:hypothetical protein